MTIGVTTSDALATAPAAGAVERCAMPGAGVAAAAAELIRTAPDAVGGSVRQAEQLIRLARRFGNAPFTPLEDARRELGAGRAEFRTLLKSFASVPALRSAVLNGPAGKYWGNTILPLESHGVFDAVLEKRPVLPRIVALYPGPTCMFRCHFCVRVTGARYRSSELETGNAMFASVIDEMPTDNPYAMYISGGLEPLTNPELGGLVARAAARGFRLTLYTNAFALTEQTWQRQPGLRELDAIRTSLYGLDDDEYCATTGKPGFSRVRENLLQFQRLRAASGAPIRLGLSYLVLPGRADRLLRLVDFIAELDRAAPGCPVDFLNLREDYSGRPDGKVSAAERAGLRDALAAFAEKAAARTPFLDIDYGYALQTLRTGAEAELIRVTPQEMRPTAHPQASVQIDLRGDVYLYREAGFPGLAGAHRYIAGRVGPGSTLAQVVDEYVTSGARVEPAPDDHFFLDGFDQVVTARLNQAESDLAAGWADARGFLR
ncbi:Radical SAM superfamily protein [Streptomyces sp. YIM 130001]|uniref:dTDP-4-amino-4,6-dideoxy-D-glucose ammonia-lyase n=1 Tax=Streptomyces sp. YIM 130001 TaxID=2259644 RepID=UPI000ED78D33|nr:dTDP-4-amino-4,6-dideoxy-D-glucose ammonia-lyase [Streptomyces sp. YIM 130001]RII07923.1 Radical SAM superfamily protein [Streptomyces sp. YIM 130001]